MFGDSVNRAVVSDYCERIKGEKVDWAGTNFTYKEGAAAAVTCGHTAMNFRFSFLNIYGSHRHGPYTNAHSNSAADPFADTQLRIARGLELYTSVYGKPDLVFFRSDLWDIHSHSQCPTQGHKRKTLSDRVWWLKGCDQAPDVDMHRMVALTNQTTRSHIVAEFIAETRWCVQYLKKLLPEATVALHTVPTPSWGLELFFELESSLRLVSAVEDVALFDFHLLFLNFPMLHYLRDIHHPTVAVTTWIGDTLFHAWRSWRADKRCA